MAEPILQKAPNSSELIAFRIAEQDFCFDIMSVREIRGWTPATAIPHAPEYVQGVINLRGAVVPVINLALRLDLEVPDPTPRNVVVITSINNRIVGLVVDAVSDILRVSDDEIQQTPDIAAGDFSGFIYGIITRAERMIRVINIDAILPNQTETV